MPAPTRPHRAASAAVSWLPAHPIDTEEQWGPQVYHLRHWHRWSDRRKLRALREMAERYGHDPKMAEVAVDILRGAGAQPRDYHAQAAALLAWVQANIYYVNEPDERLQSPSHTLRVKLGDCDDLAILLGALATSIGLPWRFVLAGSSRRGPARWIEGTPNRTGAQFSHIYVQFGWPPFRPATWMSAEPTIKGAPLGYDVVSHGAPRGAASDLPAGAGQPGQQQARQHQFRASQTPEQLRTGHKVPGGFRSAWGATADDLLTEEISVVEVDSNPIRRALAAVPWSQIILGTVQGVTTVLLLEALLKRRRKS